MRDSLFPETGMSQALFTKTQRRVLWAIFHPDYETLYFNEIVRMAAVGRGAVARELDRLVGAGIVAIDRRGNQNHYTSNRECPIHACLEELVTRSLHVDSLFYSALESLAVELKQAFLFGPFVNETEFTQRNPINLLLVSNSITTQIAEAAFEEVSAACGRKIIVEVFSARQYARRMDGSQPRLIEIMTKPKTWLLNNSVENNVE